MQSLYGRGRVPSKPGLSKTEKRLAFIASLLLILGIGGFVWDTKQRNVEQPVEGGTYTEAVVDDSPTKVDRIVTHLTNIGLTYRDSDGAIQPALAESWSVSEDHKVYTFRIRPGYAAEGLLATIQSSKTNWGGITITAPDSNTLVFTLNEPLSLFLSTTTAQIFPFGPYKVAKRDEQETILRPNEEFVLGQPYIQKVIVKQYKSQDELMKAVRDGEITASADFTEEVPKRFSKQTLDLPRYHVLFFNMNRPALKKLEDRQRIISKSSGPEVTYSLLTSQNSASSELADTLARELAAVNIKLDVQKKNALTLQKEEIPKREFDLLLYGINYGADRDYYPFWHSSQATATGLNISGTKEKELDQLLEVARREADPIRHEELNKQIEAMLATKALQHIVSQEQFTFWIENSVKGVKYGKIDEGTDRFNLIWQWYMKSKKVRAQS